MENIKTDIQWKLFNVYDSISSGVDVLMTKKTRNIYEIFSSLNTLGVQVAGTITANIQTSVNYNSKRLA